MKKAFWITTGLCLAGIAAVAVILTNLHGKLYQTTMTEETIYGDASAAKGLTIQQNLSMDDKLYLAEIVTYGDKVTSEVKNICEDEAEGPEYHIWRDGMYLWNDVYSSVSCEMDYDQLAGENDSICKTVKDLLATNPGGDSVEAKVRLADYCQYYPITMDIYLNDPKFYIDEIDSDDYKGSGSNADTEETFLAWTIAQYLKIPVFENEYADMNVETVGKSYVTIGLTSSDDTDSFEFINHTFVTDDAIYYTFDNRTTRGSDVDTSEIPGGYGIYKLPYSADKKDVTIDAEHMSTVYSSPAHETILDMNLSSDGSRLLLVTNTNDAYYVKVLDMTDFSVLEELKIADHDRSSASVTTLSDDCGLLINMDDQKMCFVQKDDAGNYRLQILADLPVEEDNVKSLQWDFDGEYGLITDGTRLAVAGNGLICGDDIDYKTTRSDFDVAVITNDGLAYLGHISSPLSGANPVEDEDEDEDWYWDSDVNISAVDGKSCTGYFE